MEPDDGGLDDWGNVRATYTVLTTGSAIPHLCGATLNKLFPQVPIHTVVKCDIDGRCWIKTSHREDWSNWRWERWRDRRRRERSG